ncbi:MAG: hypothetical protein FJW68_05320 [Actinobacteria bacterium]|nr:hypothetical protein [Actinomycetota bacterium]
MKNFITKSILHENTDSIPLMYRGDPSINLKLVEYFDLSNIENDWEKLTSLLGADNFSGGETLNGFRNFIPVYKGPNPNALYDFNHFFIWGIKPVEIKMGNFKEIVFHLNPPLYDYTCSKELENYSFPTLELFDFKNYRIVSEAILKEIKDFEIISYKNILPSNKYFLNTFLLNSLFMTSIFIRGIGKLMMDLVANKSFAEALINKIGEFMVAFNKKNLSVIGSSMDIYGIWDDIANQESLMISPDLWRKYYKPWHAKIVEEAKKYGLFVCFHICGNCSDIIGDLIEIGVDVLDPVQVSAKNMEIENLKKNLVKIYVFMVAWMLKDFYLCQHRRQ